MTKIPFHLSPSTDRPESLASNKEARIPYGGALWTVLMCARMGLISSADYSTNAKALDAVERIDTAMSECDEPDEAMRVCYEAYQVVGSLLSDLGKFDTPEAEKILDNLSSARLVHRDVLPWDSYEHPQDSPPNKPDEPQMNQTDVLDRPRRTLDQPKEQR